MLPSTNCRFFSTIINRSERSKIPTDHPRKIKATIPRTFSRGKTWLKDESALEGEYIVVTHNATHQHPPHGRHITHLRTPAGRVFREIAIIRYTYYVRLVCRTKGRREREREGRRKKGPYGANSTPSPRRARNSTAAAAAPSASKEREGGREDMTRFFGRSLIARGEWRPRASCSYKNRRDLSGSVGFAFFPGFFELSLARWRRAWPIWWIN